jgi:DNA gyrase subunit B
VTTNYGNNSITVLKGADTIRQKPASILGSDGLDGANHCFVEILANAIDEWREIPFKYIKVIKHKDNSITIRDYGRGCPLDWNDKEQEYNYKLVFMTLYAGGKYKTNEGENYEFSLGTNGLGATATQFTSKFMNVEVFRDGHRYTLRFEKGNMIGEMKKEKFVSSETGTMIHWIPDTEVFMDNDIPISFIEDLLKRQAIVNKGLKFIFVDEHNNKEHEYYYENGLLDYLNEVNDGKNFTDVITFAKETRGREREDKPDYKVKIELSFCFNNYNTLLEYYHNSSWLKHGGSPDKAVKNGFVFAIDKYLKANGKYNKDEKKIVFEDVEDSLVLVSNTFSTMTSYENQTKFAITNQFIQDAMTDMIKEQLEVLFIENKEMAERVTAQILINKRSRERADDNKKKIRKELETQVSDAQSRPDKFVPCRSKDKKVKELILIEGDSALNSIKLSRDALIQAIFPLKGKPINCLKKDIDQILGNNEVKNIFKILGSGVTYKGKAVKGLPKYDENKLEYDKICILTDGDEDGYHIRVLLIVLFYMLAPEIITNGHLYILEAPLYYIVNKNKGYIAYTEMERVDILKKLKGDVKETRYKGLGGLNIPLLSETVMNTDNRKIIQVTMNDVEECAEVLEMFMDDDSTDRKAYIEENGDKYFDYSVYED